MKPLRFTTSKPRGILSFMDEAISTPLVDVTDRGVIIQRVTKGQGAYIHGDAEELAGFDIPIFIDGDLKHLDLPIDEQEIIMLLPSGEFKCKAELCKNVGAYNSYLLTLK